MSVVERRKKLKTKNCSKKGAGIAWVLTYYSRCMMILKPNPLHRSQVFSILFWIIFLDRMPARENSPAQLTIRLMLLKMLIVSAKWQVLNNRCKLVICSFEKSLQPVSTTRITADQGNKNGIGASEDRNWLDPTEDQWWPELIWIFRYERLQITKSSSKEVHATISPCKYKTIKIWTTVWSWSFHRETNRKARYKTNW